MRRIWCWSKANSVAIKHLGQGRFSPSVNVETLEIKPCSENGYQEVSLSTKWYMKIADFWDLKAIFSLDTRKLSSSFLFSFHIISVHKVFLNMFLNNDEESAEAKSWTHEDLTFQKWITDELLPHVPGWWPQRLQCMNLKSNSFAQHKGLCHPALRTHLPVLTKINLPLWQELSI